MPISLKEANVAKDMARVLYDFLPGSGGRSWKGHQTFQTVAADAGVGDFWTPGSKEPALARLLELTLAKRRDCFEKLVVGIVREGLRYRDGRPERGKVSRKEIETLNGHIAEVGFKFPTLWDPAFLASLETDGAQRAAQMVAQAEAAARLAATQQSARERDLDDLRQRFYALHAEKDRQRAGFDFERLLNALFNLFNLRAETSFRVTGEQIDGSFVLNHEHYLLEAKWVAGKVSADALMVFREKVQGKSSMTRGVFISANGFSTEAIEAITRGKQANGFLLDGTDLVPVLEGRLALDEMLSAKLRLLADKGKVYAPGEF